MATEPVLESSNITPHPTALSDPDTSLVRTKESIDPKISVDILEIDPQSAQYSCEVTIANEADDDFSVIEVGPRLPKGTWLNEGVDAANVELVRKHGEICRNISILMTNTVLLLDRDLAVHEAKLLQDDLKRALTVKGIIGAYIYLLVGRIPASIKLMRERSFKIEINSANDAEKLWAS